MTTEQRTAFLQKAYEAASAIGHIFPGAAAAECAVESAWGTSQLATKANNLFGLKKPEAWTGETISIPTREYLKGKWGTLDAVWPVFATWEECFRERMATLHRVARYGPALAAKTAKEFIALVSAQWATDPHRGEAVWETYRAHLDVLDGAATAS